VRADWLAWRSEGLISSWPFAPTGSYSGCFGRFFAGGPVLIRDVLNRLAPTAIFGGWREASWFSPPLRCGFILGVVKSKTRLLAAPRGNSVRPSAL
jgi:hypothetical protein